MQGNVGPSHRWERQGYFVRLSTMPVREANVGEGTDGRVSAPGSKRSHGRWPSLSRCLKMEKALAVCVP